MKKISLYLLLLLSSLLLFGCTKDKNDIKANNNEEEKEVDIIATKDTIVFKSSDNIYTTFYYDGETLNKITTTSIFSTEEEAKGAEELFQGDDFKEMYGNIVRDGTKVTMDYIADYFDFYTNLNKTDMIYFMQESGYNVVE
jgi:hypothetical protein